MPQLQVSLRHLLLVPIPAEPTSWPSASGLLWSPGLLWGGDSSQEDKPHRLLHFTYLGSRPLRSWWWGLGNVCLSDPPLCLRPCLGEAGEGLGGLLVWPFRITGTPISPTAARPACSWVCAGFTQPVPCSWGWFCQAQGSQCSHLEKERCYLSSQVAQPPLLTAQQPPWSSCVPCSEGQCLCFSHFSQHGPGSADGSEAEGVTVKGCRRPFASVPLLPLSRTTALKESASWGQRQGQGVHRVMCFLGKP